MGAQFVFTYLGVRVIVGVVKVCTFILKQGQLVKLIRGYFCAVL